MNATITDALERGLAAVDDGDIAAAKSALADVQKDLGENDARVLHLQGAIAWASGEVERASGFLMQAVDLEPDDPVIYLDCAELLLTEIGDLDEAEGTLRVLLARENIDESARDEAHFLMARCFSNHEDENIEQGLEHLDAISAANRDEPGCVTLRAEILMDLGRAQEAISGLKSAVEQAPEDADLHYLLSLALRDADQEDDANASALRVYELDNEALGDVEEVDYAEVQELRGMLEEIFEDLPEPLLRRVAQAPITVEARLTREQVLAGIDPRTVLHFEGAPGAVESDDQEAEAPRLDKIIILRDMLSYGVEPEDESDLNDAILAALVAEIQRFFGLDDLVVATA